MSEPAMSAAPVNIARRVRTGWLEGGVLVFLLRKGFIGLALAGAFVRTNVRRVKRRSTVNATIEGEARVKRASESRMDAISTSHQMTARGGRMRKREKRYRRRY
jgi:hypothetical protein